MLIMEEPAGDIKKFIDYALSDRGQEILKSEGLISGSEISDE